MARYWSTPIKRVASKVAVDTRVVLAVRRQQSAGKIWRSNKSKTGESLNSDLDLVQ